MFNTNFTMLEKTHVPQLLQNTRVPVKMFEGGAKREGTLGNHEKTATLGSSSRGGCHFLMPLPFCSLRRRQDPMLQSVVRSHTPPVQTLAVAVEPSTRALATNPLAVIDAPIRPNKDATTLLGVDGVETIIGQGPGL